MLLPCSCTGALLSPISESVKNNLCSIFYTLIEGTVLVFGCLGKGIHLGI